MGAGVDGRVGTEIHHIIHWEDGGPTDTSNLVCLCRRHHRLHHQGLIGVTGNPDLPPGVPGALRCTDRWNHPIRPIAARPPRTGATPTQAARDLGLAPKPYPQRHGERLDANQLHLPPNPDSPQHANLLRRYAQAQAQADLDHARTRREARAAAKAAADAAARSRRPRDHRPPPPRHHPDTTTDPTRAGPHDA